MNCSRARCKYSTQELRKTCPELCLPEKSGGEGSFSLTRCLDEAARAGKGGLTREGDWRWSDGWCRSGAGHELGDLL